MASSDSNKPLLDCFIDIFSYVVLLKKTVAVMQPSFESVNGTIRQLFNESAQKMVTCGVDPRSYDQARFAIAAWVDETVMTMPWSHRETWQRKLLQSEYYGTMSAGSEFFDRLNQFHPEQNDVREIYYLCLGLGFMGRYSMEGDQFLLEQLKKSNLRSLTGKVSESIAYADELMFEHAYSRIPPGKVKHLNKGGKSSWSLLRLGLWIIPPVIVLVLYFVFTFVLNGLVDNLMIHVMEG